MRMSIALTVCLLVGLALAQTPQWESALQMPGPLQAACGAQIDNTIYLVFGVGPTGPNAQVWSWAWGNPSATWVRRDPGGAAAPAGRTGCRAAAVGGKLYVLGGRVPGVEPRQLLGDLWVYDPAANTWSDATPADNPFGTGGIAFSQMMALGGRLYVLGGQTGSQEQHTNKAWRLNPAAATLAWEPLTDLPVATAFHSAWPDEDDNLLFVYGGNGNAAKLWMVYNATSSQWLAANNPLVAQVSVPPKRADAAGDTTGAAGETLLIHGGVLTADGEVTSQLWRLDLGVSAAQPGPRAVASGPLAWVELPTAGGVPRTAHMCALDRVSGCFYVFGGNRNSNLDVASMEASVQRMCSLTPNRPHLESVGVAAVVIGSVIGGLLVILVAVMLVVTKMGKKQVEPKDLMFDDGTQYKELPSY